MRRAAAVAAAARPPPRFCRRLVGAPVAADPRACQDVVWHVLRHVPDAAALHCHAESWTVVRSTARADHFFGASPAGAPFPSLALRATSEARLNMCLRSAVVKKTQRGSWGFPPYVLGREEFHATAAYGGAFSAVVSVTFFPERLHASTSPPGALLVLLSNVRVSPATFSGPFGNDASSFGLGPSFAWRRPTHSSPANLFENSVG